MKTNACLFALSVLTLCVFIPLGKAQSVENLIVSTRNGKLKGAKRSTGGAEFLGIPYAQPPVGDRRWREPLPVKSWKDVREATTFGAPCAQAIQGDWNKHDSETSKEDCLYLN